RYSRWQQVVAPITLATQQTPSHYHPANCTKAIRDRSGAHANPHLSPRWTAPAVSLDHHAELSKYSEPDRVIWSVHQILLGSQISLSGLNRRMAQEQLDLLRLAARGPAEFGASATKIVGRESGYTDYGAVLAQHLPDNFLAQAVARNAIA